MAKDYYNLSVLHQEVINQGVNVLLPILKLRRSVRNFLCQIVIRHAVKSASGNLLKRKAFSFVFFFHRVVIIVLLLFQLLSLLLNEKLEDLGLASINIVFNTCLCSIKSLADSLVARKQFFVESLREFDRRIVSNFLTLLDTDNMLSSTFEEYATNEL